MDLKKYYYLTNDAVFKKIFGSEKNRDLLISFLSAILNIPKETMSDVTVKNPEITPENIADKFCRLDLSLSIDGTDIDVEMQVGKEENFGDRLLVYWAKMYSATLGKGNNYWGLKKCISLAFVDFEMFPEHRNSPKFHYNFAVTEKDLQFPLSDKLDAQIVELRKVPNFKADENNELMWLNFLKAKSEEEIDMIGQTGTSDIQKAANAWRDFNADESNRIIAMNREFAELARNTALYNARIQGKQEGLLEGLLEGERKKAIFTAKKLIKDGMPYSKVADFTDLSISEVESIANQR